jgi:hypothetical protein
VRIRPSGIRVGGRNSNLRHRLASRKATTLGGLSDEVFVFYHRDVGSGLTDAVIAACERSGFRSRVSDAPQAALGSLGLMSDRRRSATSSQSHSGLHMITISSDDK